MRSKSSPQKLQGEFHLQVEKRLQILPFRNLLLTKKHQSSWIICISKQNNLYVKKSYTSSWILNKPCRFSTSQKTKGNDRNDDSDIQWSSKLFDVEMFQITNFTFKCMFNYSETYWSICGMHDLTTKKAIVKFHHLFHSQIFSLHLKTWAQMLSETRCYELKYQASNLWDKHVSH